MFSAHDYIPRLVTPYLQLALSESPAVLLNGPRQCGKTTLAGEIAKAGGYEYYSFDDGSLLDGVRDDPMGFVRDLPEKVVLDEVQKAPDVFPAIKMEIDRDRTPGRFLLTGSANVYFVPKLSESLAGRMYTVPLYPLSQCEIERGTPDFLDRLFSCRFTITTFASMGMDLYERALRGGYPGALKKARQSLRRSWYREYVDNLIRRDIYDLGRISTFDVVPKLVSLASGQTARLLNVSDLAGDFELSRPTIRHYVNLLQRIFLLDYLPSWHTNQLKRLVKKPKLHIGDTGLAGSMLELDISDFYVRRTLFGQILESFVFGELKRQASWQEEYFDFFHFRDQNKVEVDIVVTRGLRVAGIEVKSSATVSSRDFRGLKRMRDSLGKDFVCGVVLYSGEHIVPFGDRLFAVPISALWSEPQ